MSMASTVQKRGHQAGLGVHTLGGSKAWVPCGGRGAEGNRPGQTCLNLPPYSPPQLPRHLLTHGMDLPGPLSAWEGLQSGESLTWSGSCQSSGTLPQASS